jgi:hypothetical protein
MRIFALSVVTICTCLLLSSPLIFAEETARGNIEKPKHQDVHALLEEGQKTGMLPEGAVLKVHAHLFGLSQDDIDEAKANGKVLKESLSEAYEFTSNKIRRIDITREEGEDEEYEIVTTRVETRPYDSKELCKTLLQGKFLEIDKREGTGDPLQFVGTNFRCGGRAIELKKTSEEEVVLINLSEHCATAGYHETDARAFAALYEQLAKLARQEFANKKSNTSTNKKPSNK